MDGAVIGRWPELTHPAAYAMWGCCPHGHCNPSRQTRVSSAPPAPCHEVAGGWGCAGPTLSCGRDQGLVTLCPTAGHPKRDHSAPRLEGYEGLTPNSRGGGSLSWDTVIPPPTTLYRHSYKREFTLVSSLNFQQDTPNKSN